MRNPWSLRDDDDAVSNRLCRLAQTAATLRQPGKAIFGAHVCRTCGTNRRISLIRSFVSNSTDRLGAATRKTGRVDSAVSRK
jgi:hypothetical protein